MSATKPCPGRVCTHPPYIGVDADTAAATLLEIVMDWRSVGRFGVLRGSLLESSCSREIFGRASEGSDDLPSQPGQLGVVLGGTEGLS